MKNDLQGMTLPTCDILVNGQKRKFYGKKKNKIYLRNGDNFQLKIFNPLQERVGVQLKINAAKVDNDLLIINPGQEVTVDRYIGSNNKLTFSAYEIDTTNMSESRVKEVHKAIEKNGILEIIFWNEKKTINSVDLSQLKTSNPDYFTKNLTNIPFYTTTTYSGSTITISQNGDVVLNGNVKINGTLDINNGSFTVIPRGTSATSGTSESSGVDGDFYGSSATFNQNDTGNVTSPINFSNGTNGSTLNTTVNYSVYGNIGLGTSNPDNTLSFADGSWHSGSFVEPQKLSKKIETGRIEKGSKSDQYFSHASFDVGEEFFKIKFKLLPFSLKPVKKKLYDSTTIKNVVEGNTYVRNDNSYGRDYCKCGYRVSRGKGSWSFCPYCGRKIKNY